MIGFLRDVLGLYLGCYTLLQDFGMCDGEKSII
jgi:hypothetical protein